MLSDSGSAAAVSETAASMSVVRKHDIAEQEEILAGKEQMDTLKGGGIMFNVISSMLFGSKPMIESYLVDTGRIEIEKTKKDGVDFVSSNDIIVSSFGEVTQARLLLMPFNMRGKVKHFNNSDAGNYESALGLTQ